MIIEMRTYKLKPGCRERFLDIFRTKSMPVHDEIGMKILGHFSQSKTPTRSSLCAAFPIFNRASR